MGDIASSLSEGFDSDIDRYSSASSFFS